MSRGKTRLLRRCLMLGSATWVIAVSAAQATTPSCSEVNYVDQCTQGSGSFTTPIDIQNESANPGVDGLSVSLTTSGTFNVTAGSDAFAIRVTSTGTNGVDDGRGGNGGFVTIDNTGTLKVTQSDGTSELIGIDARSVGGNADTDNDNNGSSGGNGGGAGAVTITNTAAISLDPSLPEGGTGIYALSQGGSGGEANVEAGINQPGGNGGAAGTISISNTAAITMGSASTPVANAGFAYGVQAESNGGSGDTSANGNGNVPASGAGGTGGAITISNSAQISLHIEGTDGSGQVMGIMGSSAGGAGAASSYNYNSGGSGGSGGNVTITLNKGGDIDISTVEPVNSGGAGISATSRGGKGGQGNKQDGSGGQGGNGGSGGAITVTVDGSSVTTQGIGFGGIFALSAGGDGGPGDDENKSSGGSGGTGGAIQINLQDGGSVSTTDEYAYGILGQSIGGLGGNTGNDTAIFGTAGSAGAGGNSSSAGAFTSSGTTISTKGDFAAGIAFQSIGGVGTGGSFVGVLRGSAGNGGNGGSGLRAAINSGSTITTEGDHAYGLLAQAVSGSGGTAEVLNTGNITTKGYGAIGIVLQSIAGGGGAAGSAGGLFAIGGNSDTSYTANGGNIDFSNSAQIKTSGDAAIGILAQSIGGGGGTGAGSVGIDSVGGSGSAGGSGGTVVVRAERNPRYGVDGRRVRAWRRAAIDRRRQRRQRLRLLGHAAA
ncbi:MAG TPA: hypothetical protein PKA13_10010 [Geminicoccaceae bacterium]|nr:hypothetical protein [Geminicoccus sp.]HMU50101.1 hypothetical protein [Geminicoccaceae bacterium]